MLYDELEESSNSLKKTLSELERIKEMSRNQLKFEIEKTKMLYEIAIKMRNWVENFKLKNKKK